MAHNLSYDEVIFDYTDLLDAIRCGVTLAIIACEDDMSSIHKSAMENDPNERVIKLMYASRYLNDNAKRLAKLTDSYHALQEGLDRHKKSFVNDMSDNPKFPNSKEE